MPTPKTVTERWWMLHMGANGLNRRVGAVTQTALWKEACDRYGLSKGLLRQAGISAVRVTLTYSLPRRT